VFGLCGRLFDAQLIVAVDLAGWRVACAAHSGRQS
jgi:hypothetical protein